MFGREISTQLIIGLLMRTQLLMTSFLATATVVSGVFSTATFAQSNGQSNGNTVVHTNVVNSLGSSTPITVNRESHSVINNPGIGNVHVDNNLVLSGSCGKSTVNNNVSHQGSIGASTNVVVDVCLPDANGNLPDGRQNRRR
jgi:hypothetical protein